MVELTAGWVPSFLLHLDGASDFYALRHGGPYRPLAERPSDYFLRQVRVAALPYEMPNRLVPKVGDQTFMLGSDWPHAEGVADPAPRPSGQRTVWASTLEPTSWGPTPSGCSGYERRPGGDRRERERLRAPYLAAPAQRARSTARGVHHIALMCADVERTIRFYQGLLGFPLVEIFENRDYRGSTHLFFDIGSTTRWPSSTSPASTSARTPRCWVDCTTSPFRSIRRCGTRRGPSWTRRASTTTSTAVSPCTSVTPTVCGWN